MNLLPPTIGITSQLKVAVLHWLLNMRGKLLALP